MDRRVILNTSRRENELAEVSDVLALKSTIDSTVLDPMRRMPEKLM